MTAKLAWQWMAVVLMSLGLLLPGSGLANSSNQNRLLQQATQYKATFTLSDVPKEGRAGLRLVFPRVDVKNDGQLGWPKGGSNQIRLAYRWFYGYGAPVPKTGKDGWDDLRADLPQDIPAGGIVRFPQFVVGVPATPGDYVLHLNMLQGETFFADKGSPDYEIKVNIKAADKTPPNTTLNFLPLYSTATTFPLGWSGSDEAGGSGLDTFDVQYRLGLDGDWRDFLTSTTLTSTQFTGENGRLYQFRIRANDKAGNAGNWYGNDTSNGYISTRIDSLPPTSKVNTLPMQSPGVFLVRWSSYDNVDLAGPELYDVQYREGNSGNWVDWIKTTPAQSAVFKGEAGRSYAFRVRAIDYAGNLEDYPTSEQASTAISAALDSLYAASSQPMTGTTSAIFPLITKSGESGSGTSGIVIKNPGQSLMNVTLRLNNRAGAPITRTINNKEEIVTPEMAIGLAGVETIFQTIEPGASYTFWTGNISTTVLNGWASITSAAPFQATAIRLPAGGVQPPIEYAASTPATKLYMPLIRKDSQTASSTINLVNPGTTAADFTISYYDSNGGLVVTETRKLGRLSAARFSLFTLPTSDPALRFVGSAVISSSVALAASVETPLEDGSTATYPAQSSAGEVSPQLDVYKELDGVSTSLLIQNTGKADATVKIEYLDQQGQLITTTSKIVPANGRASVWQGDIPELKTNFSGKARLSSPGNSLSVVALGTGPILKGRTLP